MSDTIPRILLNTLKSYPKPDFVMAKKAGAYAPISTQEFGDRVKRFSLGLKAMGFESGDKFIILCENRPEWVMADLAALSAGGVTVPIYTSLLPDQVRYIVDHAGAKIAVCSDRDLLRKIEAVRGELPGLEHIVLVEGEAPSGTLALSAVLDMGAGLERGSPGLVERTAGSVRPGDLASIIYTSGTTGLPKGVMLSHGNFVSNIEALTAVIDFRPDDTVLSFLPLSHVLERTGTFLFIHSGATIAYAESIEAVAANLVEVRPTIVVSVPRLFEKIYTRVTD